MRIRMRKSFRGKTVVFTLATLALSSCTFFSNREDALPPGHPGTSPVDSTTMQLFDADSGSAEDSARIDYASNLVRSSGLVLHLRLASLFPTASTAANATLDPDKFASETSTSISRPIAAEGRPSSALTQVALRSLAATLCKRNLDAPDASSGDRAFFSSSAMLSGESPPSDPDVEIALLAARNGWLDLYTPESPEVVKLAELHRSVRTRSSGGGDNVARQAVCMAVLMAPQFLLGNTGRGDPIRRLSLELGHRLPKFQEISDYVNGNLTMTDFVRSIQEGEETREGYRDAVKVWHKDWWGLREFRSMTYLHATRKSDPRGEPGALMGVSELGSVALIADEILSDGHALVQTTGKYSGDTSPSMGCSAEKSDGTPNEQTFDPRASMVVIQHRNTTTVPARWEVVAGWVHQDRLSEYQTLVRAYHSSFSAASNCTLMTTSDPKYRSGQPLYYRCRGSVAAKSGSGFISTEAKDYQIMSLTEVRKATATVPALYAYSSEISLDGSKTTHTNALANSVHYQFTDDDRRILRKSPSGWQDGVSKIKLWWSGDYAWVCNGFARYRATCFFRASSGRGSYDAWEDWFYTNLHYGSTPAGEYALTGSYMADYFSAAPMVLNQFRCGVPNVESLPDSLATAIDEDESYPRGYSFDSANYLSTTAPSSSLINSIAFHGLPSGDTAPYETAAIERAQEDLLLEPYRLIDHVLDGQLPYSDLVTAPYTFGRYEMELAYRSQFLTLPSYPADFTTLAPDDPRREAVRKISRAELPPIPASWTRGPYLNYLGGYYTLSPTAKSTGWIPPAPASGILTMPAFQGPVTGIKAKHRTLAARIFDRLLCSSANGFTPEGDQIALHEQFMGVASNPAPAAHMDRKTSCYGCHVNLDPLGAALSGDFLANVQKNEPLAAQGYFLQVTTSVSGRGFMGARGNSEVGQGAFMGQPASGYNDIGAILAETPAFYRCVVRHAFEKVLGRAPLLQDAAGFERISNDFMSHRDFNRMIREIATSNSYQREN